MADKIKITIHHVGAGFTPAPDGRAQDPPLHLPQEINLYQGLRRQGVFISQACGGQAKCGKCKVRILAGNLTAPAPDEQDLLTSQEISHNIRLACRIFVSNDLELEILQPQFEAHFSLPSQTLPEFNLQPVVAGLALAVDIGTTNLDISLIDLKRGTVTGEISAPNRQIPYGMDVLSRITGCQDNPAMVRNLRELIVNQINQLTVALCQNLGQNPAHIYQAAIVGNPTMLHLFAGIDPKPLGQAPYVPVFKEERRMTPEEAGLRISPEGQIILIPSISAFVGADTVAGIIAAGMAIPSPPRSAGVYPPPSRGQAPALLMDLGTNGEMSLAAEGKLWATSCAAGPALEGMNITCGMRAIPGAIERVNLDGGISYKTIGGKLPPLGLCGSGVIDLAAQIVHHGLADRQGKLLENGLVTEIDRQPAIVLFQDGASRIYFTQLDFRQVQLARGAIRSAVRVLLAEAGLQPPQIAQIFIAGAFGSSIREESLHSLSILPQGFSGKTIFLGNAAKTGAALMLLDSAQHDRACKIAQEVTPIELSIYPDYQRILARNLLF